MADPAAAAAAGAEAPRSTARYLYAVSRGVGEAQLEGLTGLRDARVELVPLPGADLVCAVSDVDLGEFGEAALAEHLEDLAWLEEVARTHDAVVNALAARGPAAPLRLATICSDDEAVRHRLGEHLTALSAALDRVTGRVEFSVKAYVDDPGGDAEQSRGTVDEADGDAARRPGAGAEYLRRRRDRQAERERAQEVAHATAESVHHRLASAGGTVASRVLAPQDPRLTGHRGTMTLNAAYLVESEHGSEFVEAVEALAGEVAPSRLEVRGPWPPYSFATLDES